MPKTIAELYADRANAGKTESLTTEFASFSVKGDMILGTLLSVQKTIGKEDFGECNKYTLQTDTNKVSCLLGAATDKQLEGLVKVGDNIAITYMGKKELPDGNRKVNIFEIEKF